MKWPATRRRPCASLGLARSYVSTATWRAPNNWRGGVGGSALGWTQLSDVLPRVDLVVSATSAPHVVIEADLVRGAMTHRADRPLLLVDIALPRDVDTAVDAIANVTRLDIDHLRDIFDAKQQQRDAAIPGLNR